MIRKSFVALSDYQLNPVVTTQENPTPESKYPPFQRNLYNPPFPDPYRNDPPIITPNITTAHPKPFLASVFASPVNAIAVLFVTFPPNEPFETGYGGCIPVDIGVGGRY